MSHEKMEHGIDRVSLNRACPRTNFVGSLCRNTPHLLQNSTKFATKAADKEPKIEVLGQALFSAAAEGVTGARRLRRFIARNPWGFRPFERALESRTLKR